MDQCHVENTECCDQCLFETFFLFLVSYLFIFIILRLLKHCTSRYTLVHTPSLS